MVSHSHILTRRAYQLTLPASIQHVPMCYARLSNSRISFPLHVKSACVSSRCFELPFWISFQLLSCFCLRCLEKFQSLLHSMKYFFLGRKMLFMLARRTFLLLLPRRFVSVFPSFRSPLMLRVIFIFSREWRERKSCFDDDRHLPRSLSLCKCKPRCHHN